MKVQWNRIEKRWRRGETAYSISKSLKGVPARQTISKRAKQEDWAGDKDKQLMALAKRIDSSTPHEEVRNTICKLVEIGVTDRIAAGACGIKPDTLEEWKLQFPAFKNALGQARFNLLLELEAVVARGSRRAK